jgi:hypothetical protein
MNMWIRTLMIGIVALTVSLVAAQPASAQVGPHEQALTTWYRQYLGRDPDPAGWQTHLQQMYAGVSYEEIQSGILASEEYFNNAGRDPWTFVNNVYLHTFGRRPAPPEAQYFASLIPTGQPAERVNAVRAIRQAGQPQAVPWSPYADPSRLYRYGGLPGRYHPRYRVW